MHKTLLVLTLAVALTLACATATDPEEQATSSETNQTSEQIPETTKQDKELSEEAEKEIRRQDNGTYCLNASMYVNAMDRQLYELIADAEAGLEHPIDFQIMEQQAMFAFEESERFVPQQPTPPDAKKLGRSIENYHEKVTEFYENFDQSNAKKVHRGLENLVDDFPDLHSKFADFCEDYGF